MGSLPQTPQTFDALIIGAGLSGLRSLYHLRQRHPDWRVKVLDAAPDVGGTWYWNCYPGCRFDSESVSYGFSFDKDLLDRWHWKETFSPQPGTHKYVQCFASKHDLYKHIQFDTVVKNAQWNDSNRTWHSRVKMANATRLPFWSAAWACSPIRLYPTYLESRTSRGSYSALRDGQETLWLRAISGESGLV